MDAKILINGVLAYMGTFDYCLGLLSHLLDSEPIMAHFSLLVQTGGNWVEVIQVGVD
jgi:hypothetical protein